MTDDQLREILNQELAKAVGQIVQPINRRLDQLEAKLDTKAEGDRVYRVLDGIARRLDADQQERAAMTSQLNRHERWHHQTADKIAMKLSYSEQ